MYTQSIPIEVKDTCCKMHKEGTRTVDIYNKYYKCQFKKPQNYNSFRSSLTRWLKKFYPDETTLTNGTYKGFTAHDATVQVSSDGEIVQAWIKQKANEIDPEEFLEVLKDKIEPYEHKPQNHDDSSDMLEISLFDMHWGVAYLDYYIPTLDEILDLIYSHHWNKIVIPFGQDFFHNDSIVNGQTTKGTVIEKVDMKKAVKEGQKFIYSIIDSAIAQSDEVRIFYSPGNHDRSISWMFMQILLERYGPDIVDDTIENRKIITYGLNSIMVTHGDAKRATPNNLAHIFPVSFPEEFAKAKIREVHAGHLHTEFDTDVSGIMVRRLSTGNKTDAWTDSEDFIGTHKRFEVFEWSPTKLKSIHYV